MVRPKKVTPVNIDGIPLTTFDVQLTDLETGGPTRVPWTEFEGNPEQGKERFLHVGARAFPIREAGYLREVAVWRTGVVWFEDFGLRFLGPDGKVVRVKGVPAWYGRLTFGPRNLYFVKRGALWSVSAPDLIPRSRLEVAELTGVDEVTAQRSSIIGLLDPNNPLFKVTYRAAGNRVANVYSAKRGDLPLPPEWTYVPSPVGGILLARPPRQQVWAAFDSTDLSPLWTHSFVGSESRLSPLDATFTPSGRKVLVPLGRSEKEVLILDAATGKSERRVRLPSNDFNFETDSTVVYTAYDGPPNPFFDPRDTFPEPSELNWPNVIVRCSLDGDCERAARVDAPERSLVTGPTHLFPPR
jgi:hypothetical protein